MEKLGLISIVLFAAWIVALFADVPYLNGVLP